jgi:hypothetical protein
MRMPTLSAAVVSSAVMLAVTAASPRPAEAFFFPLLLGLGGPSMGYVNHGQSPANRMWRDDDGKRGASTRTRSRDDDDGKAGKASTRTRSRDDDAGKAGKASTRTRSRDDDAGKAGKASTRTRSRDDDGKSSSGSAGKGARVAEKAYAKANSDHGARQTSRAPSAKSPRVPSASTGEASPGGFGDTFEESR